MQNAESNASDNLIRLMMRGGGSLRKLIFSTQSEATAIPGNCYGLMDFFGLNWYNMLIYFY